jgi:low affinity Fe/Cu permease
MRSSIPVHAYGGRHHHHSSWYSYLANKTAHLTGRPATFLLAAAVVVVWALTGPLFGYSDTWQLVINTGTTIVTFLMVFLIQATQNRDTEALQVKLDELILATQAARNDKVCIEEEGDEEIEAAKLEVRERAAN